MSFKDFIQYDESKQVGFVYHFTKFENIQKLLKGNKELNLEILEFISYNGVISTTRNYSLSDDVSNYDFPLKGYNIIITIDGNRLSNKYKIRPILGYIDNDLDIFNQSKNL